MVCGRVERMLSARCLLHLPFKQLVCRAVNVAGSIHPCATLMLRRGEVTSSVAMHGSVFESRTDPSPATPPPLPARDAITDVLVYFRDTCYVTTG
jgi:hypothetical protein